MPAVKSIVILIKHLWMLGVVPWAAVTLAGADAGVFPGADEQTPSWAQYFSWINNTNEGSTEKQTLINLAFFKWLHDEYGMDLDIYALDAGNIDGLGHYGSTTSDQFKKQFPHGFAPIYKLANSFGCRLGVWLGPDGFGDTPDTEQARIDMLAGLCRDYEFVLFKMDAVCGQLRPEKQPAFIRLMQECRRYSPDLILLNHRLRLGAGEPYATTFLWGGAETYIDVHMANWDRTGTHNRVQALSRGLVPGLKRLTEDHGVCLSSCLDYWDDDLILQAFNRSLILAPEIYANPWFLRDDEFPKLARIYNLHRRYRQLLVNGMVLDNQRYGPFAVSRGDAQTRLITLRNLTWQPVTYQVELGEAIGLKTAELIQVRQFHPTEKILGEFNPGQTVGVEVLPFRACLLLATTAAVEEVGLTGCDYQVVRDIPDKPVKVRLLGLPGTEAKVSLVAGDRKFTEAALDGQNQPALLQGESVSVKFPGLTPSLPWHRQLGTPTVCEVPADAEALFEATCFAADNDPLEIRSLKRSGPTLTPAVRQARQAFLDQAMILERGILDKYLFDDDVKTVYRFGSAPRNGRDSRTLRIDLGEPIAIDSLLLVLPTTNSLQKAVVATNLSAECSADLRTWRPAQLAPSGPNIKITLPAGQPVRYVRTTLVPAKVAEIRGFHRGTALKRSRWRCSFLFDSYAKKPAQRAWSLAFTLNEAATGSYLTIPCAGIHGTEGAYVALRVAGKLVGVTQRAPSFPCNPWEYPVGKSDRNYSYFVPVTPELLGKQIEVVVLALDPAHLDFKTEVWITAYPLPYAAQELVLTPRED